MEHNLIEQNWVCSIKLKHKVLRGESVLVTLCTPQIPYGPDDVDADGKAGDIVWKYCREWSGTGTSLKEGNLHSQQCDYHRAGRISLFTQLLIKFLKQGCYSESTKEILHLCGNPKFYHSVKNSTLLYLKQCNITSWHTKT